MIGKLLSVKFTGVTTFLSVTFTSFNRIYCGEVSNTLSGNIDNNQQYVDYNNGNQQSSYQSVNRLKIKNALSKINSTSRTIDSGNNREITLNINSYQQPQNNQPYGQPYPYQQVYYPYIQPMQGNQQPPITIYNTAQKDDGNDKAKNVVTPDNQNLRSKNANGYDMYPYDNLDDAAIFSKTGEYPWINYCTSYASTTFGGISMFTGQFLYNFKASYDEYEQGPVNNSRSHSLPGFVRWMFERDILKRFVPHAISLFRILTNWNFEWKNIVAKYFSISFTLNHLIWPGVSFELNSGYFRDNTVGLAFRIGLDEILKISIPIKIGSFYIKINTVRLATIDLLYIFYENGTSRNSGNNPTEGLMNTLWPKFSQYIDKFYYWDINNPLAEKIHDSFKDSILFSMIFGGMSIELGGIFDNE